MAYNMGESYQKESDLSTRDLEHDIERANKAADQSREWREGARHRTKRGAERDAVIRGHLSRLSEAMEPIRSAIGRLFYEPLEHGLELRLRDASANLQYERRQLKKMLSDG